MEIELVVRQLAQCNAVEHVVLGVVVGGVAVVEAEVGSLFVRIGDMSVMLDETNDDLESELGIPEGMFLFAYVLLAFRFRYRCNDPETEMEGEKTEA
jgi:hypothetical protein